MLGRGTNWPEAKRALWPKGNSYLTRLSFDRKFKMQRSARMAAFGKRAGQFWTMSNVCSGPSLLGQRNPTVEDAAIDLTAAESPERAGGWTDDSGDALLPSG